MRKNDRTLESKFEAHYLHSAGLKVVEISKMLGKDRSTIYYRIDLIDDWIRLFKGIRDQYQDYVERRKQSYEA